MTKVRSVEPESPDAARVASFAAAGLGVMFALAALALYGGKTALSVGAGALLAVANLVALTTIVRALLRQPEDEVGEGEPEPGLADDASPKVDHKAEGKRGGAAWGAFALVKILVLFGGIWVLLTRGLVSALPLAVGYGVLPLGITVGGLFASLGPRSRSRRPKNPAK